MKISDAYPSNYLKASDLAGREAEVTIDDVHMESFDNGDRPVVTFVGKEKGLALNRTNATELSDVLGEETDAWHGKKIKLYTAKVNYKGSMVDGIRVRIAIGPPPDDEIPF